MDPWQRTALSKGKSKTVYKELFLLARKSLLLREIQSPCSVNIAIVVLAGTMHPRQRGFKNESNNRAFGLLFETAAGEFAIAVRLEGHDIDSRTMEEWRKETRDRKP